LIALLALRAATGLCAAAVIPLGLAYIGDKVPYGSRQRAITNLMSATATGGAMSTAVGGILGSIVSWRMVFVLYGVIAMVIAAFFFRLPVEPPQRTGKAPTWQFREVLADSRARLIYALVAIEGVVVLGAFTYLGSYLRDEFGIEYFLIGLILACYGLGTLMTSKLLFPSILRGVTERSLVLFGGIALGVAYLALAPLPVWPLTIPPMLLMGMGFAMFHSTLQTRTTELAPHARGTAVSLFAFCAFVGGGIGSAGFGWMVEASGYGPFLVVSGLLMLAIGVVAFLNW
jgi:predicted MFS family arabinose efflux permease